MCYHKDQKHYLKTRIRERSKGMEPALKIHEAQIEKSFYESA